MTAHAKTLMLTDDDRIVAVVAEPANGPGWSNTPLWIVIRSGADNALRMECLQPEEQGDDVRLLYGIAAEVHAAMVGAVERYLGKRGAP